MLLSSSDCSPDVIAHRSESIHTALVGLAANILYDEGAQSAAQASTSRLPEEDNSDGGEAEPIGSDQDDDAASFKTAEGRSDEAAALGDQVTTQSNPRLVCATSTAPARTGVSNLA